MNQNRFCRMVLGLCAIVASISAVPASADNWIDDSLELQVADADLVVRAKIQAYDQTQKIATLIILNVLKGDCRAKNIQCAMRWADSTFADAHDADSDVLVMLVKSQRYHFDPNPNLTLAVRNRFGENYSATGCSIISLDPKRQGRVGTSEFKFIKKPGEILDVAMAAIKADADSKVPHLADGAADSIEVEVPNSSSIAQELHNNSLVTLKIPINESTEAKAEKWIESEDQYFRLAGVQVLAHFKSAKTVALLKSMLKDVTQNTYGDTTTYPIRAEALVALKNMGVEAVATTQITTPPAVIKK